MQSSPRRLLLAILSFSMQSNGQFQLPCDDTGCRGRFPEGGYCTTSPTSPNCDPKTPKCTPDAVNSCYCCRNCHDYGCSSVGKGWSCVNETTAAASDKHCVVGQDYCWSSGHGKCFCCPPIDPMPCKDRGCRDVGGHCVKESQSKDCWKIHTDSGLCFQNDENEKCLCCLKPPKPCNQTSPECEKRGPGYSCVPREEAADWPVPCHHSCYHNGDRNCMCCPPKPVEVNCMDTGCSKEFPGFECKNASIASVWPKRCLESDKLCSSTVEKYEVNMTADNAFHLYADGVLLGSGSNWPTTYSFSTDASEVLAVYAWNWGGPVGILLSTSAGLVTDSTWKCIDAHLVTSADWYKPDFNDMSWPNAVVFGYNGVSPWGTRPGISASAQWIWAPTPPHGSQPQKVYCRKKLETPRCYCCPPILPINNCTDTGCEAAFGEGSVGECKDVTNPDFRDLSQTLDLLETPTGENLCNNTVEKSSCRCFKKKPCLDIGCHEAFGGDGICVDVENDDLSIIDFSVEKKLGLCKNALKKDCCFCYKKHSKNHCHYKSCTFEGMKGQCVGPNDTPPPNHVQTEGECGGKDCVCWVPDTDTCSRDPVCEESLHGQCVPDKPGANVPHHKPSTYKCKSKMDNNCTCWTPYCENSDCKEKGGRCILPWDRVPVGYEPNGLICNEKLDCKCYARKPCELTDECKKLGGNCRYPDDPRPADEVDGDFCDKDLGCKCYYIKQCINPRCTNGGGLCVLPGQPVPSKNAYSYRDGDFCDKEMDCKCYRPKCTNKTCTNLNGRCYMKGMLTPQGSRPVILNGKPFLCSKKPRCKCLKVAIDATRPPVLLG